MYCEGIYLRLNSTSYTDLAGFCLILLCVVCTVVLVNRININNNDADDGVAFSSFTTCATYVLNELLCTVGEWVNVQ